MMKMKAAINIAFILINMFILFYDIYCINIVILQLCCKNMILIKYSVFILQ